MPCNFCLACTEADGFVSLDFSDSFFFFLCNSRMMSSQDQEETDPPTFTEAQQAWIERLIATKIPEAAPTSTTMTTSDTTDSLGALVGSTLPATTAGHSGIGEYSVKMGVGVKGDKHNNYNDGAGNGRIQVTLCLASSATAGRRLNGQSENQKGKGEAYHGSKRTEVMTCWLSKHAYVTNCG